MVTGAKNAGASIKLTGSAVRGSITAVVTVAGIVRKVIDVYRTLREEENFVVHSGCIPHLTCSVRGSRHLRML